LMGTEVLRIAVLGAGIFAKESHIVAINKLIGSKEVEVKAIYSRTLKSAEQLRDLCHSKDITLYHGEGYTQIEEILKRSDIDVVDVILPILELRKTIELCFKYGKHVISEKPLCSTIAEGKELIDLYEKKYSQLVWSVAENFRYMSAVIRASDAIKEGRIGKILMSKFELRATISEDSKYYNTNWRKIPGYQGGFLLDGGVHFMAFIRAVVGEVKQLSAQVTQLQKHLPPADTFSASFTFVNGSVGSCDLSFGASKYSQLQPPRLHVIGEKGAIIVQKDFVEIIEGSEKGTVTFKPSIDTSDDIAIIEEFRGFLRQIKTGTKDRNSPREALNDLILIESILVSGSTGKTIVVGN